MSEMELKFSESVAECEKQLSYLREMKEKANASVSGQVLLVSQLVKRSIDALHARERELVQDIRHRAKELTQGLDLRASNLLASSEALAGYSLQVRDLSHSAASLGAGKLDWKVLDDVKSVLKTHAPAEPSYSDLEILELPDLDTSAIDKAVDDIGETLKKIELSNVTYSVAASRVVLLPQIAAEKNEEEEEEEDDDDDGEEEEQEEDDDLLDSSVWPRHPSPSNASDAERSKEPCRYGDACYRRDPSHFERFSHPSKQAASQSSKPQDEEKPKTFGFGAYAQSKPASSGFGASNNPRPKFGVGFAGFGASNGAKPTGSVGSGLGPSYEQPKPSVSTFGASSQAKPAGFGFGTSDQSNPAVATSFGASDQSKLAASVSGSIFPPNSVEARKAQASKDAALLGPPPATRPALASSSSSDRPKPAATGFGTLQSKPAAPVFGASNGFGNPSGLPKPSNFGSSGFGQAKPVVPPFGATYGQSKPAAPVFGAPVESKPAVFGTHLESKPAGTGFSQPASSSKFGASFGAGAPISTGGFNPPNLSSPPTNSQLSVEAYSKAAPAFGSSSSAESRPSKVGRIVTWTPTTRWTAWDIMTTGESFPALKLGKSEHLSLPGKGLDVTVSGAAQNPKYPGTAFTVTAKGWVSIFNVRTESIIKDFKSPAVAPGNCKLLIVNNPNAFDDPAFVIADCVVAKSVTAYNIEGKKIVALKFTYPIVAITAGEGEVLIGTSDGQITQQQLFGKLLRETWTAHERAVTSLAFLPSSPQGLNTNTVISTSQDAKVNSTRLDNNRLQWQASILKNADTVLTIPGTLQDAVPSAPSSVASSSAPSFMSSSSVASQGPQAQVPQASLQVPGLVVARQDGEMMVLSSLDGSLIHSCQAHPTQISCIAVTKRYIITSGGSRDTSMNVWDWKTGQLRAVCTQHKQGIFRLETFANGTMCASISRDGMVCIWHLGDENNLPSLQACMQPFNTLPDVFLIWYNDSQL
jgi:hypothetical protein